ncbi:MAG: amino acid ABC transporter ATP-binding protein [Bosea sp.]|uniref:amino acid ABC transporter ATP-binding protein n=1 Tax=Bosea sp. (in: a-proteobacteria) TaxID=1871050 RepID=UPI00239D4812|nr:amino acid ABC transporter ATP-binding protein [Bosea sp. (in: a-proteobacteria)]MCP4733294.1 amino acid ABC transporter ATP-binding protein [Bosea sp. (in: a-proteobacteria)]
MRVLVEALRTENLKKRFGDVEVLRGIDLSVRRGETVVVLGASGSGKSTMLRCLNFLETPSAGKIYVEGRLIGRHGGDKVSYPAAELTDVRAKAGMVFQQFNLFPHLTVEQNVTLGPMRVRKMTPAEAKAVAARCLDRVGLAQKAQSYPSQLSGGQQQRVAIARALAMEPSVVLFDEPTSALDPELVGEVLLAMRQLADDGTTMVVVTHELGFAYNVANRVVFLHEGRIHEEGPPHEILVSPRTERMREFLKSHSLFRIPEPTTGQEGAERA